MRSNQLSLVISDDGAGLHSKAPVLVLSMHDESIYGERAIRAGAKGFLTKQEASKKVISAIRTILSGEVFVSERMKSAMLKKMAGGQRSEGKLPTDALVTANWKSSNCWDREGSYAKSQKC